MLRQGPGGARELRAWLREAQSVLPAGCNLQAYDMCVQSRRLA